LLGWLFVIIAGIVVSNHCCMVVGEHLLYVNNHYWDDCWK
jgi:hypothetical protein